ncbi:MAG TPA: hypothetical protein PL092_01985 [Candidatus Pacearchaeota archaeon]|nr:hypothetical protein [Candidatus Pacearchaeota archaeon]
MNKSFLKAQIIDLLKNKGNHEDIDDFFIDDLIFNIGLLEDAKESLLLHGTIEDSKWGRRMTPELLVYQMLTKEVKAGWGILGITPRDRRKLKLEEAMRDDEFDKVFDNE